MISFPSGVPEEPLTTPRRLRKTYVYLMRNTRNGFTKIGVSDNPNFRERTLQSEEPEVELIYEWRAPMYVERYLHAYFSDKRVRGEWFKLDLRDIAEFYVHVEEAIAFGPNFKAEATHGD